MSEDIIPHTGEHDGVVPEEVARQTGEYLFRVMNLEGHNGVIDSDGNGSYTYSPANTQYPDQGDFAFRGENAFDTATVRAFPNHLNEIHALEVVKGSVVEPYPDDMPGVVYVENGSIVHARKVPPEIVEEHINRINNHQEPLTSQDVIARMSTRASV